MRRGWAGGLCLRSRAAVIGPEELTATDEKAIASGIDLNAQEGHIFCYASLRTRARYSVKRSCVLRWIFIPVLLATMAFPSWAAKRMTVAQLEQMLGEERAAHKLDIEIARKLGEIELAERLTDVTLGRLNQQFSSGSPPAMALLLLADRSAFLAPPANELPATPAPDAATQQNLLEAAKRFAVETLPHLPNLLATRTTFSFDDSPQEVTKGGYLQRTGLHLIGSSKAEVSVRNERENPSTRTGTGSSPAQGGLVSWGEFGSALLVILSDSNQGKTMWSHWEQTPAGVVAVFQYEVPKTASHYEIDTPVEQIQPNGGSNRWARTGGMAAMTVSSRTAMVRSKPGYQGFLWLDPATGTILRVTLVADLKGNPIIERGAILVEYGPVPIAGKSVICPVRSLAISSAPATVDTTLKGAATEWLNENLFTGYHMFASTSRIVDEQATAPASLQTPKPASAQPDQAATVAGGESHPAAAPAQPAPQQGETPSAKVPPVVPAPAPVDTAERSEPSSSGHATGAGPAATTLPAAPSVATSTASQPQPSPIPVTPDSKGEAQSRTPTIELNVSRILVPVVVRDKLGRAVGDLKKEDFQVFDEGQLRPVSAFAEERRGSVEDHAAIGPEQGQQPVRQDNAVSQSSILPERITVFLFDDLHLSFDDTALSTKAASGALEGVLSGPDMAAVVSTSGKVNSGLTRDRAKLRDALKSLRPQEIYRSTAADCVYISYYQADLIVNKRDAQARLDAIQQVLHCNPGIDPQRDINVAERLADSAAMRALNLGRQDVLATYAAIKEFVLRMAGLPGQRTLVLVSPGFLPIEQGSRNEESRVLDLAAESNVTISALDARGLYTSSIAASDNLRGRAPEQVSDYRRTSMSLAENAMGELAGGTGGTFFHNSNDLDAGFKAITEAPEVVYMLELPLDGVKANGTYHRLRVKVDREGMEVQARRGYFVPEPEKRKR